MYSLPPQPQFGLRPLALVPILALLLACGAGCDGLSADLDTLDEPEDVGTDPDASNVDPGPDARDADTDPEDTDVECEETDREFCERHEPECGTLEADDECGEVRTVDCSQFEGFGCAPAKECSEANSCECADIDTEDSDSEICNSLGIECGEHVCAEWEDAGLGILDCGYDCEATETCFEDEGVCGCTEDRQRCDEECVLLDADRNHCGSCGDECDFDQACRDGVCISDTTFVYSGSAALQGSDDDNAETDDSTVRKIDGQGQEVWVYDEFDESDESAGWVHDLAVDPDGYVYAASRDGSVHKISPDGEREWDHDHVEPARGVAVTEDGAVYVLYETAELKKFNESGSPEWIHDDLEAGLRFAIAVDSHRVYAGSENLVTRNFDNSDGNHFEIEGDINGIATKTQGVRSFITRVGHGAVAEVSYAGEVTDGLYDPGFDPDATASGTGVALGPGDDVHAGFEGDSQVNSAHAFSGDNTEHIWEFSTGANVFDVAVDPQGYTYVAMVDGTVAKVDDQGQKVWSFDGHDGQVGAVAVDPGTRSAFPDAWTEATAD